jgi:hypothetical protein
MRQEPRTRRTRVSLLLGAGVLAVALTFLTTLRAVGGASSDSTRPATTRPHPLKGVAAIVEADIVSAQYTYDDTLGPRAIFTLANVTVHSGAVKPPTTLSQFGGPLPDGTTVSASGLPVLTPGSRYIVFLGTDPWFYTPVWSYLAFRVEKVGSRSVVVGPGGAPVTGFSANGITFAGTTVVDLTGPNDPLAARPALTGIPSDDPEIGRSLDHDAFVATAIQAATDVGADFTAPVPLVPSLLGGNPKWNVTLGSKALSAER